MGKPLCYVRYEIENHNELLHLYNNFFKNDLMKITYNEFVIFCYNHTSHTTKHSQWMM